MVKASFGGKTIRFQEIFYLVHITTFSSGLKKCLDLLPAVIALTHVGGGYST